jgi:hypothetical protein
MERMKQGLKRLLSTPPETHKEIVERRRGEAGKPKRKPRTWSARGSPSGPEICLKQTAKGGHNGPPFFVNGGEVACRIRDRYEHMRVALYREAYFLLLVQGLARDSVYRQHDSTSR